MNNLKILEEKKPEFVKNLWYFTQYESCCMADETVLSYLVENAIKNGGIELAEEIALDPDLEELLSLAPEVSDEYNEILYKKLMSSEAVSYADLAEIWEKLAEGDLEGVCDFLNIDIYELDPDLVIGTPEGFEGWADEDLKANGIDANAIYWAKEIPASNYCTLDIYNIFSEYDSLSELIEEIGIDTIKEEIEKI